MVYKKKENNYKKVKTKKIILGIIGFIVLLLTFLHTNPTLSVKTNLFLSGHPVLAFNSSVEVNNLQTNLDKEALAEENSEIYKVSNIDSNDNSPFNFKVKKIGILYFATPYGEA